VSAPPSVREHLALQEQDVPHGVEEGEEAFDPEDIPLEEHVVLVRAVDLVVEAAAGDALTIPLATGIDLSRWVSLTLNVMLHSASKWYDCRVLVYLRSIDLDPDQPSVVFDGPALAEVDLTHETKPPAYLVASAPQVLGALGQVSLYWSQNADALAPQQFRLSVSVVGRRHIFSPALGR